jgi:hypothetical protein
MSLFRIAVVLSLGVAVMPSDREQQDALYDRAATAAHWTLTYCDRNTQHCQMAGELWDAFLAKAEFAGKLAYDVALRSRLEDATGGALTAPISAKSRGTLNNDDLRPNWRGDRDKEQGGA